jgi:hypothetical protein
MSDYIRPEENLAGLFLKKWFGPGYRVENLGNGDTPDIKVSLQENLFAYAEVKRDADRLEEQMRARLNQYGVIDLNKDSGSWLISLDRIIDLQDFRNELQRVVNDLNSIGENNWDKRNRTMKFKSQDFLLNSGVSTFRKIQGYEGDRIVMIKSPKSGVVIGNSNFVIPWLEELQYRPEFDSSINRLALEKTQEQHLFIFADSKTPHDIESILQFHPTGLPSERFHLSKKLTHIWVAAFFNFQDSFLYSWMYSDKTGWSLVQIEN